MATIFSALLKPSCIEASTFLCFGPYSSLQGEALCSTPCLSFLARTQALFSSISLDYICLCKSKREVPIDLQDWVSGGSSMASIGSSVVRIASIFLESDLCPPRAGPRPRLDLVYETTTHHAKLLIPFRPLLRICPLLSFGWRKWQYPIC